MSITIINLSKRYKNREILDRLTYIFRDNTHYVIKGENGIGKSTLFKSILNQVKYSGYIEVEGVISYVPEDSIFPPYMSVIDFLTTFSCLTSKDSEIVTKIDEFLDIFKISSIKYAQLGSLSKGQKQKVNLIQGLISKSDILLIDEPLNALDDESKETLINLLDKDNRLSIIISHEITGFKNRDFKLIELKDSRLEKLY